MNRNPDNDVLMYVNSLKQSSEYVKYDFDHELPLPKEVQFAYTALVTANYNRYQNWFDNSLSHMTLIEALARNRVADLVNLEKIIDRTDHQILVHTNATVFVAEHESAIPETLDLLIGRLGTWHPTQQNISRIIATAAAIAKREQIQERHIAWLMGMVSDNRVKTNLQHNPAIPEDLRVSLALL